MRVRQTQAATARARYCLARAAPPPRRSRRSPTRWWRTPGPRQRSGRSLATETRATRYYTGCSVQWSPRGGAMLRSSVALLTLIVGSVAVACAPLSAAPLDVHVGLILVPARCDPSRSRSVLAKGWARAGGQRRRQHAAAGHQQTDRLRPAGRGPQGERLTCSGTTACSRTTADGLAIRTASASRSSW